MEDELEALIRFAPIYKTLEDANSQTSLGVLGAKLQVWEVATAYWPLPDGRSAPRDFLTGADKEMLAAITMRQSVLHTLGNLTLITVPGNTAASNSKFSEKCAWLKKSLLALNLQIVANPAWAEPEIQARARVLADAAVAIWPPI